MVSYCRAVLSLIVFIFKMVLKQELCADNGCAVLNFEKHIANHQGFIRSWLAFWIIIERFKMPTDCRGSRTPANFKGLDVNIE